MRTTEEERTGRQASHCRPPLRGGILLAGAVLLSPWGRLPAQDEPRTWPVGEVSGEVSVGGSISAGAAASEPEGTVRLGELGEGIREPIGGKLREWSQAPADSAAALAVAENLSVTATGPRAHAEGYWTAAAGAASHAEGGYPAAAGVGAHAEGNGWLIGGAAGRASHVEGTGGGAWGSYSHAEGSTAFADGGCSHAEGSWAWIAGFCGHAEGVDNVPAGHASHAQGTSTRAVGPDTHTEGVDVWAESTAVHAGGAHTIVTHGCCFMHAAGQEYSEQKQSHSPYTGHFDRLYAFESWGENPPPNAVLNVGEMDQQYLTVGDFPSVSGLPMGNYTQRP